MLFVIAPRPSAFRLPFLHRLWRPAQTAIHHISTRGAVSRRRSCKDRFDFAKHACVNVFCLLVAKNVIYSYCYELPGTQYNHYLWIRPENLVSQYHSVRIVFEFRPLSDVYRLRYDTGHHIYIYTYIYIYIHIHVYTAYL